MPNVLEMLDVCHSYGGNSLSLENFSINVKKNEKVCLLGPSGSGKSTALSLIAGILKPTSGTIKIDDRIVSTASNVISIEERSVSLAFQESALFSNKSAWRNVSYASSEKSFRRRKGEALHFLRKVKIRHKARSLPDLLSAGQQQRVALARALISPASLLMLDEPFASLDIASKRELRVILTELLNDKSVLLVTHDPEDAFFLADRICVMENGHLVQSGTAIELSENPVSPFVMGLFGEFSVVSAPVGIDGLIQSDIANGLRLKINDVEIVEIRVFAKSFKIVSEDHKGSLCFKVLESRFADPGNFYNICLSLDKNERVQIYSDCQFASGETIYAILKKNGIFIFDDKGKRLAVEILY